MHKDVSGISQMRQWWIGGKTLPFLADDAIVEFKIDNINS